MPTKKGEQWYADWIVAADVYMDLAGSPRDSKDEVLHRLDELLRQQGILTRLVQYVYACTCNRVIHLNSFCSTLVRSAECSDG